MLTPLLDLLVDLLVPIAHRRGRHPHGPLKLITHYRQRAASEPPRELRRHPPKIRYTLLAALCWQREREITDNLVELLIRIAHKVGVRAEEKVVEEFLRFAKKVVGEARLLYKFAKA
ncbi:MAG: hypothetical protein HIU91_11880 [Acidobacteria bacterium]|nr:hypothetical protein [Acidobacteriota bacterium]